MTLLLWLAATGCSDNDVTRQDGVDDSGDAGETTSTGVPRPIVFTETFDDVEGPPFVDGYPSLPLALFPDGGDRFTQLQDDHPGLHDIGIQPHADGGLALFFRATGESPGVASKMAIVKQEGIHAWEGDLLQITVDLFVDPSVAGDLLDNTLVDLEEGDDLFIDGMPTGAGIRLAVDGSGHLSVDRGELLGSDAGEDPHFRLENMASDYVLPIGQWVTIDLHLKLGVSEPLSLVEPIDDTFDGVEAAGWVELYVEEEGGEREQILRMKGTTFLDRSVGLDLLAEAAPSAEIVWPEGYDFETFQMGLTNNKSGHDALIVVDDLTIEHSGQ